MLSTTQVTYAENYTMRTEQQMQVSAYQNIFHIYCKNIITRNSFIHAFCTQNVFFPSTIFPNALHIGVFQKKNGQNLN